MENQAVIEDALKLVEAGRDLSMDEMAETIGRIMEGRCGEDEIARLLGALHRKGETVAEVAGAAAAMRRHGVPAVTLPMADDPHPDQSQRRDRRGRHRRGRLGNL